MPPERNKNAGTKGNKKSSSLFVFLFSSKVTSSSGNELVFGSCLSFLLLLLLLLVPYLTLTSVLRENTNSEKGASCVYVWALQWFQFCSAASPTPFFFLLPHVERHTEGRPSEKVCSATGDCSRGSTLSFCVCVCVCGCYSSFRKKFFWSCCWVFHHSTSRTVSIPTLASLFPSLPTWVFLSTTLTLFASLRPTGTCAVRLSYQS